MVADGLNIFYTFPREVLATEPCSERTRRLVSRPTESPPLGRHPPTYRQTQGVKRLNWGNDRQKTKAQEAASEGCL